MFAWSTWVGDAWLAVLDQSIPALPALTADSSDCAGMACCCIARCMVCFDAGPFVSWFFLGFFVEPSRGPKR